MLLKPDNGVASPEWLEQVSTIASRVVPTHAIRFKKGVVGFVDTYGVLPTWPGTRLATFHECTRMHCSCRGGSFGALQLVFTWSRAAEENTSNALAMCSISRSQSFNPIFSLEEEAVRSVSGQTVPEGAKPV